VAAPRNDRNEAIADIEAHLAKHGPTNYAPLRERYSHVPEPTFWRWVKAAKQKPPTPALILQAREKLAERAATMTHDEVVATAAANLPAAPSPDFIAKSGERGQANLNLLERFHELYADAMLLRAFAMNQAGGVKNPMVLAGSISLRNNLLNTALKATEAVYDFRRIQAFWDSVMEEIAAADPEIAKRIMERLHRLNSEIGMSAGVTV
jgi:hypothetical protein